MKRHDTSHAHSEHFRILADFARKRDLNLSDETSSAQLLEEIRAGLRASQTNPICLHGFRVQSMFAYVAAALGNCRTITEEDSGLFFDELGELRQPDFRLLTKDGGHFMVEVKNFHPRSFRTSYSLKSAYIISLSKYAQAMGVPLKFAVFWSRWKTWTMVDAERLNLSAERTDLSFQDALKWNEMNLLGDSMIGTVAPLALRLHADRGQPRIVNKASEARFTIGGVSLHAGDAEILDEVEKKIAWFMILNGNWADIQHTAKLEDRLVDFTELSVRPEEQAEGQGFDIIGTMSQMISRQYITATSEGDVVKSLAPKSGVEKLGVIIPQEYSGKILRLWRFHLRPQPRKLSPATFPGASAVEN